LTTLRVPTEGGDCEGVEAGEEGDAESGGSQYHKFYETFEDERYIHIVTEECTGDQFDHLIVNVMHREAAIVLETFTFYLYVTETSSRKTSFSPLPTKS